MRLLTLAFRVDTRPTHDADRVLEPEETARLELGQARPP